QREGGDDLREGEPAAAAQEEAEQEEEVVVTAQDVLDAEEEEAPGAAATAPRRVQRDPGLPRLWRERELLREARRLDPGQRVVVGAQDVEQVVADDEVAHGLGAA